MRRLPELYGIYHEPWQARLVRVQADLDTGEKVLQETEVQQVRAESHSSDRYYRSKATRNGKGIYYGPVNNPRITWRAETAGILGLVPQPKQANSETFQRGLRREYAD